jgi:hypothetical protein
MAQVIEYFPSKHKPQYYKGSRWGGGRLTKRTKRLLTLKIIEKERRLYSRYDLFTENKNTYVSC